MHYYPTFALSSAVFKMFRRLYQSIKNYIRGPPPPKPTEEMVTQNKHSSQGLDSGRLTSSSAVSSEKVKSHCPTHDPTVIRPTAPMTPGLDPKATNPATFTDSLPPPPYVETPRASAGAPLSSARSTPDIDADISHTVNDIMDNTTRLTENIMTNVFSNLAGVTGGINTNAVNNVNYYSNNGTASYKRGPQQGNRSSYSHHTGPTASGKSSQDSSSSDFTFDFGPGAGSSSAFGGNGGIFHQSHGPGGSRNVFIASGGSVMTNCGNTISIVHGTPSTSSSSYS
ncbi:hypothetical protein D9619_010227 [Psilocybe cf. subviscida]|uniref:Uncharacterized protein n=1 Tax=Psilocybe cf. subviscida TaxID=2480587 RepID=A0A8H5ASJ8_9AGAR|nr:hypothetical protein D9619_010227 [Psilocybe cf. subviscida]